MKSAEKNHQFSHIYMIIIVAFFVASASFLLGYVVASEYNYEKIVSANNTTKEMTSVTFEADKIDVNGVQYNLSKDKIKTISFQSGHLFIIEKGDE